MLKTRRLFGAAGLLPFAWAVWSGAAAAQQPVQDANTVGAPQLRDFTLPGTRTTPPVQVTPPAATPAPRTAAPGTTSAPARQAPAASSRPARPAPERAAARPRTSSTPAPRPAPVRATPQAAPTVQLQPQPRAALPVAPVEAQPQPVAPPPAPVPAPQPAPAPVQQSGSSLPLLWLLAALILIGGGGFLLLRRRRVAVESDARDRGALAGSLASAEWLPAAEPAAQPVAAQPEIAPVPPGTAERAKRARLEVDIRPERASTMEDGTLVQYGLILTNTGEVAAGNIRIDSRMFNASGDGEVDGFFNGPIHELSGSPHVFIQPGESIALEAQVGMKRDEQHAIEVQGRVIFVPLVAINVAYDWEGGGGRTSTSWLVGRTPSTPAAKMGAFRLDLGPRIYRQVDRREAKKALV